MILYNASRKMVYQEGIYADDRHPTASTMKRYSNNVGKNTHRRYAQADQGIGETP